MNTPDIQLVCFDLGRVLERIAEDWEHACTLAGIDAPSALRDPEVLDQLRAAHVLHESGGIDGDEYDRRIAARTGMTVAQATATCDAWIVAPFEGARALLHEVTAAPVQTACLSNTNARHWRIMGGGGPRSLPFAKLDYRFASHLIGAMKPSHEPYEYVERTTAIAPGRILFFDDLPANVETARDRGWQAVRVEPDSDAIAQLYRRIRREGILPG